MKVGLIAPPWISVPPPSYGGTEAVLDALARGLLAAGDDVQLFTTGDSTCPVPRASVYERALGTAGISVPAEALQVVHAYEALADCDVIHDNTIFGPLYAATRTDVPVVTTNHGPFAGELRELYRLISTRAALVAVSHHQRSTAPEVPVAAVIHHGVDVERMPFGRGAGGYVVFLGRMNEHKGPDRAIQVARAAGIPLLLAAKMWEPAEHRYFHDRVEPLLGDDAVYVGEVGGRAKLDLLGGAIAMLNPICWPEPFGLVMVEALTSGTPVIAFAEGAAPEIIDHGVTGFLCEDEAQMVEALTNVAHISRAACRAAAVLRFSTKTMVDRHRQLYRCLVDDRRRPPATVVDISAPYTRGERGGWAAARGDSR